MLRKWFELTSVVPLGVYVLVHLGSYLRALFGATEFGAGSGSGFELALEIVLVWLPLGFHALYGAWLTPRPIAASGLERNRTLLLRASGIALLAFLAYHSYWLRRPHLRGERSPADVANALAAGLSATEWGIPIVAIVHLLGLGALCVHLAAGLARSLVNFGLAGAARAQLVARALSITLFCLSSATVVELATGSALPNFVR